MLVLIDGRTLEARRELLDVEIESRISHAAGTAQVRLWNWDTSRFDLIGVYPIGQMEAARVFSDLRGMVYVSADGEASLQIEHIVVVPVFAFVFHSYFDRVELRMR